MRNIIAIDPGTTESAWVSFIDGKIAAKSIEPNSQLRYRLDNLTGFGIVVCEKFECFGMAVGAEVFETVRWTGRFEQTCLDNGIQWEMMPRRAVKMHLCQSMRAKDQNVRQALIDRFGGKLATKKGQPLHGIASHLWSALAIGITFMETHQTKGQG